MSTRSRQKISSILALASILALLLLLVFVWTAVRNGAFYENGRNIDASQHSHRFHSINWSETTTTSTSAEAVATTDPTSNRNYSLHHHAHHLHHPHHRHHMSDVNSTQATTDNINSSSTSPLTHHYNHSEKEFDTIPNDVDATAADQLIKPSKIHVQPLHADDLLYESTKFDPSADTEGKVPEHRITGQYRNKSNRIWDPHPQYLIDAFGLHLHLILYQDNNFIPKSLKITHIWNNEIQRKADDHKDHEQLRGCFYRGRVRTDDRSTVAVSLCDGMRGHIYTSSGSFFIEPIEEYTIDNQNILHKISREKLLDEKLHSDKIQNGKVLIDDISSHDFISVESVSNSITAFDTGDDVQLNVNRFNEPEFDISGNISCSTEDGKNCTEDLDMETTENMLASTTEYIDSTTWTPIQSDFDDIEHFTIDTDSDETKSTINDKLEHVTTTAPPLQRSSRKKRHISNNNYYGSNSVENNAYTMEVMVAVDRKMQEYHGQNIKAYVLTLMSIVSNIYADASIGNSIDVAVVHIMLLKDDLHVESNNAGVSASQMLSRFCKFVHDYPFQHDTALLLTREQICRNANQKKCDTLGLAELGTMCLERSCAIVQDNGLSAAFTIAHELGHVLSMPHDDDIKCKKFRNEDGSTAQHIMSRMLDHNTHPWSWSACSRHYVTEYLEHKHGTCMLNKPMHDLIETASPLLAGEKFSANQQCELVFGANSKVCPFTVTVSMSGQQVAQPPCVRLWCGSENEGCRTQHMPWADGTECGAGLWCQHGKCVARNRKALIKIDGGWGPWKPFDQCSRQCGGGVQSSTRECNSPSPANGGKYCIGTRIKYRSCNIHDCPPDMLDFREQQCAEMNNNSFGILGLDTHVRWVPKYGQSPHDECKLYCRVEKTNNYFILSDKVKDGTTCNHDTFNKCVNGICQPAACNNQLDSDAKLDKCGVCNGNNETCMDIEGTFRPEHIERAKEYSQTPYYYHVTVIPKGASNIEIKQPGRPDDLNYIALMDDKGAYILNGYNVITQYPRVFAYGGITFEYTGTNSSIERVNTTFAKRLKRDLTVEILSRSEHYESEELVRFVYTMSLNETRHSHTSFYPYNHNQDQNQPTASQNGRHYGEQYKWVMSDWSECNNLCDGEQYRTAACKQIDNDRTVPPNMCRDPKPDDQYQVCNAGCVVEWEIQRSKCSVECGEGVQQLSYKCIQTFPQSNHRKVVDEVYCPTSRKTKLYEKCHGSCASAVWTYEEYGPCSKPCNGGVQSRTAYCTSHHRGQMIDERYCVHSTKDVLEQSCNTHECPKWQYGDESPCSVTCDTGFKVRSAICVQNNTIVNSNECDEFTKPKDLKSNCQLDPCWRKNPTSSPVLYSKETNPNGINNNYNNNRNYNRYDTTDKRTPWSNSQTTYSNRRIYPITPTTPAPTTTTTTKPTTTTINPYHYRQTYRFIWRTSRWSPCSATCDGGVRTRAVRCISETTDQAVDDRYCTDEKPVNITNCGQQRCPKWRSGDWGQCNDDCKRHRQVVCQDERHHNNITNCPLNTRPHSTEECCQFRWRNLWSPCSAECGSGTKSRQRVCMKLFPHSRDPKQQIRKKGRAVDNRYCSHMRQPPFTPKTKECRKQNCALPKWELGLWSKCSVGCGKGYSSRQLVCTLNGKSVNELICSNQPKPQDSLTKHCETFNECRWKTGEWKQCSCTGYTKRRVQCFDLKMNRQSNSCPEQTKPELKKRCDQPPNCSCKGLQRSQRIYQDADYPLLVRGRKVHIYCQGMNTTNPKEYITLKDHRENYSSYYERRSLRLNECVQSESDQVINPSLPSGITYFSKVRLDLHTLQVIIDDFTFAQTMGRRQQSFGSAGDCFSTTQRCPRGSFSINFENTKFRIRPKTRWDTHGNHVIQQFYGFEAPYQKVTSVCGGYCGRCIPSHETGLHLEVI